MIYLELEDLLFVAERVLAAVQVRDLRLLESAVARPRTTVFGELAHPDLKTQAAALIHSIAHNRALVDGNMRLALGGVIAFLGLNGFRLTLTNEEAYELVMSVCQGHLEDVAEIATRLRIEPR